MKKVLPVLVGLGAVSSVPAFAAVPTTVSDALTAASADAVVVAGLVVAIIVAIAAFKYMRRAIS